jgi:glycosyltransferase involved in cell wall biosynthesis
MPKFVLILMVKNESKIIERCMKSVEGVVNAFCITDTGSTDNTCDIVKDFLKTHKGCLIECEWKNFGHNRTISFVGARDYVRDVLKWDLKDTYGLLLDGDMVFEPGTLKEQTLGDIGYSVIQVAGNLQYPNCRLVRMDYDWICRGVTHEYWDGPTSGMSKNVCFIDDRNDGGCKSDKFERDARLLEKGLEEEPDNVRYMFYLAQTYHSLGRWKDSLNMYKKRIDAQGWFEERWYSMYMIAQCYQQLDDPIKFEQWMLKARAFRPERAESVYKLTKYFREKSQHYKAYSYYLLGKDIPLSTDSLFIEKDVYNGLFDYEATILLFYLGRHAEGLQKSMEYLLTKRYNLDNVYNNMKFYVKPIGKSFQNHPVLRMCAGPDYHPTSVSIFKAGDKTYHNVRFVNYSIDQRNGSYMMKEGNWSDNHRVRTQNVVWDGKTARKMDDSSVILPRRGSRIAGLEDVRVYRNASGDLRFVAVTAEYSDKIRVLEGGYDIVNAKYTNCRVLESPTNAECEKNWIPVTGTDDVIYRWHPVEVGKIEGNELKIQTRHETPWFFHHLRGSAVPMARGDELWCLVHYVEYSQPRKYFHCFVVMNKSYKPLRVSLPFVFREEGIEYCIGTQFQGEKIECIFSSWDDNPMITHIPLDDLSWVQL